MDGITDPKELTQATLDRIGFTEEQSQKITDNIKVAFSDKIKSGQVTPSLKAKSIKAKRLKGYSKPDAPLYGTGDMADSLKLGNHDRYTIEIVSSARVSPNWHMSSKRAKNVPRRDVLTIKEIKESVEAGLGN